MEGSAAKRSINYRALSELFDQARDRAHGGMRLSSSAQGGESGDPLSGPHASFEVRCSVLEIHNERVVDLLRDDPDTVKALDIRQGGSKGVHVPGLTQERCTSLAQVQDVIKRGQRNRSVGATDMNLHSSRSHLVVQISIAATYNAPASSAPPVPPLDADDATGAAAALAAAAPPPLMQTVSKLTLVDLAGSERLARSKAEGDRLRETQAINKSLAALGDCIAALAHKKKHVPFRNSKLTFLLQDSLGGDAKTLMFCNVSPSTASEQETLCSLQFAQRVRKVEKGAAQKQTTGDDADVRKLKAELERERSTAQTLKQRVAELEKRPAVATTTTTACGGAVFGGHGGQRSAGQCVEAPPHRHAQRTQAPLGRLGRRRQRGAL